MATLLDQFRSAVDMMHAPPAVPQAQGLAYAVPPGAGNPMAYIPTLPPVQTAMQYPVIPISTAAHLPPTGKDSNFLSKNWPIVVGVGIILIALVVAISFVIKNKGGKGKSRARKNGANLDEDDDEDLNVRVPSLRPQPPHPQQGQQIPRMTTVASAIPTTQDLRYTEVPLRGAPLPMNTRGAEQSMQPMPGMYPPPPSASFPTNIPQQSPVMPMPGPTTTAMGIPLAPMQPQNGVPGVIQPLPPPQGAQQPQQQQGGDPNFTKL